MQGKRRYWLAAWFGPAVFTVLAAVLYFAVDVYKRQVMSIGNSFEAAMMKAVSSIELGMDTLTHKPFEELTDDEIVAHLHVQDAERVFCV